MISLPDLQNNTGRFIVIASPPCAVRPASAALIGRLPVGAPQRRAAPGSSGAERKRKLGRQRAPTRAGRADDVM